MKCHSCGVTAPAVQEQLEDGGYSENGHEDVNITVKPKKAKKQKAAPEPNGGDGMAWWVKKTGVPEDVWDELGCVTHGTGVAFTFAGMDAAKIRKGKEIVWAGTGKAEAPPLWPVPEDELPKHVYIQEGESDTGTMRCAGYHAFGLTKGAGKGEKRYLTTAAFEALRDRGVEEVTICGDGDESGDEMNAALARTAVDAGLVVNVVRLQTVLDPFSGIKDVNAIWRAVEKPKQFHELLTRATQRVASRYPVLTAEHAAELAEEDIDWLVPELLAPSDKVLLSGPQKSYKTWIALDLVRCLVDKKPWMKRTEWVPPRSLKVLFVQEEGSKHAWAKRIRRLHLKGKKNFFYLHRHGIRFTESDTIDEVIGLCKEHQIQVLIFDPLQRMMPGVNENDSSETGIVWDEIMRIQLTCPGIVVIVLHHANKTEALTWESVRGSSRHGGEVDLGIFVARHPIEDDTARVVIDGRDIPHYLGTGEAFEAKVRVSREGEQPFMEIDATEIDVKIAPKERVKAANIDSVISALDEGCTTVSSIVSQTDLSDNTVKKHLATLIEDGRVTETDNGAGRAKTYELTQPE